MIRLKLSNRSANEGVNLDLPATPAEVSESFSWFERIGVDPSAVRIAGVNSPVPMVMSWRLSITATACGAILRRATTMAI